MNAFIQFVREQGVVGLAVGFILGGAVSKLVTSLAVDIIQPFIGLLVGSTDGLRAWHFGPIMLGSFLIAFIDFLVMAAVVYLVVKGLRLDRLDKKKQ